MQLPAESVLLRIFTGESDRHAGHPLYEGIVLKAREVGLAGATVLRGAMGFGPSSRLHTSKILRLSEDLPLVIEIVDTEEKINAFLPILDTMMGAGITAILAKVGVAEVNSHLATAIRTVVVLIFTWTIALSVVPWSELGNVTRRTYLFLVLSGIATGLSWLCYFRALQLGEASRVAPVDKLSVVFAIVLAAVFLREKLTWQHFAGGTLIVTGALLLTWKPTA